jgi:hypothetical protein
MSKRRYRLSRGIKGRGRERNHVRATALTHAAASGAAIMPAAGLPLRWP